MSGYIKKKLYRKLRRVRRFIKSEFVGATIAGLAGLILYLTHILVIVVVGLLQA